MKLTMRVLHGRERRLGTKRLTIHQKKNVRFPPLTSSEVVRGNDSQEEREKGIGVEGRDMEGMGRKEGRDGGKERSRDRGEGWAVENDAESIPEGGGGGAKGAQPLGVKPVAARWGEMELVFHA